MRNLPLTLVLCVSFFTCKLHADKIPVICSHLENQEDMVACAGKGSGLPVKEPGKNASHEESYLKSGFHIVGRTGNGLEVFLRIFKVGQKAYHLCTGQYADAVEWTAKTLIYNAYETCDHATEAFDTSVRHYISSTISHVSQQLGTATYYLSGAFRLGYLGVALFMDIKEFSIEKGRSTPLTIMNGFLTYITFQNLATMVYETLSPAEGTAEKDEL